MKHFFGLSIAASLAVLATACSSSTTTTTEVPVDSGVSTQPSNTDAGNNNTSDAGGGGSSEDAGTCPSTPSASSIPTLTAPALKEGACDTTDIAAFATACTSSNPQDCETWANNEASEDGSAGLACASCLIGASTTVAPVEIITIGNAGVLGPSLGACVLAQGGSAACAAAVDEVNYCVNVACYACDESSTCGTAATAANGPCTSYLETANQTACSSSDITLVQGCENSSSTVTGLTATATAICGSGGGTVVDAGTADAAK